MKKLWNCIGSALLLSGCVFRPAETENEAFLPLAEQYRRCGIRQAEHRVENGSAFAAGKDWHSYAVASACLAHLRAENDIFPGEAYRLAGRALQYSSGARYYSRQCKHRRRFYTAGSGWEMETFYNFSPNNYSYITPPRKEKQ